MFYFVQFVFPFDFALVDTYPIGDGHSLNEALTNLIENSTEAELEKACSNVPADFAGVRDGKIQPVVGDEGDKQ